MESSSNLETGPTKRSLHRRGGKLSAQGDMSAWDGILSTVRRRGRGTGRVPFGVPKPEEAMTGSLPRASPQGVEGLMDGDPRPSSSSPSEISCSGRIYRTAFGKYVSFAQLMTC